MYIVMNKINKIKCLTYQNKIRNVFAISNAKQTCNENPSASWVCLICLYCGTYGIIPPITIAVAAVQPTTCRTVRPNSSFIIQSIVIRLACGYHFGYCVCINECVCVVEVFGVCRQRWFHPKINNILCALNITLTFRPFKL